MITVLSLITASRLKLGDIEEGKQHYDDSEIIDALNDALAVVSEDLLCFTREWTIEAKECVNRYLLPADFLRPILLTFNGKNIKNIKSLESRITSDDTTAGASYDSQTFHLFLGDIKKEDKINIYYNNFETVADTIESIPLPNNAKEVLQNYMLHLLFQKPIRKDGLKKSEYYLALYERKKLALLSRMRANIQSQNMKSTHIKV